MILTRQRRSLCALTASKVGRVRLHSLGSLTRRGGGHDEPRESSCSLCSCSCALGIAAVGATAATTRSSAPTKLTIWVGWSARELSVFKQVVAEYDKTHPNVQVNVVGNINDDKIVAAIRAGNAPGRRELVQLLQRRRLLRRPAAGSTSASLMKQSGISAERASRRRRATTRSTAASAARCRCSPTPTGSTTTRRSSRRPASRGPPKTHHRADRGREEADEVQLRTARSRCSASTRSSASTRTCPERWVTAWGAQVARLDRARDPREAARLVEVAEVAEEHDRLDRLQQARPLPGRARRRVLRARTRSRSGRSR